MFWAAMLGSAKKGTVRMLVITRLFAALLFFELLFCSAVAAQTWEFIPDEHGNHVAGHKDIGAMVVFVSTEKRFYVGFRIYKSAAHTQLIIKFVKNDGSDTTFAITPNNLKFGPLPYPEVEAVTFYINRTDIELFQSASFIELEIDGNKLEYSLSGSRAAIDALFSRVDQDATENNAANNAQSMSEAVSACDRLAAHAWDQNAKATGVSWNNVDGEKAIIACERARDLGNKSPRIIYQLGRAYDKTGNKLAFEYMHYAGSEHGYPAALYHLGLLHQDGTYTPKNPDKAEQAFRRGHELGNIPSKYALGEMLFENATTAVQQLDAEALLQESAIAGYPQAMEYFSILILDGKSSTGNFSSGLVYLTNASDKGQANASYRLATMFRDGIIVSADEQQYQNFLKLAAQQGSTEAKKELGD